MNLLDIRDSMQLKDQQAIAARFCRSFTGSCRWRGQNFTGTVTWGPDRLSFAVEHLSDQCARWIGYAAAEDEGHEAIWWGTEKTERGTYVAQFQLTYQDAT